MRRLYPWMTGFVLFVNTAGNRDIYGNYTQLEYATYRARVSYGARSFFTEAGDGAVVTAEAFVDLIANDFRRGGNFTFIEVEEDIGSGVLDAEDFPELEDFSDLKTWLYTNNPVIGTETIPNRQAVKRSMFNKNYGYFYVGRTGAE